MSNRSEIVAKIATELGTTQVAADKLLVTVTSAVREQIAAKGHAVLPRFGRFKIVDRQARQGRNPRTGAAIQIPAKQVVKFKTF